MTPEPNEALFRRGDAALREYRETASQTAVLIARLRETLRRMGEHTEVGVPVAKSAERRPKPD